MFITESLCFTLEMNTNCKLTILQFKGFLKFQKKETEKDAVEWREMKGGRNHQKLFVVLIHDAGNSGHRKPTGRPDESPGAAFKIRQLTELGECAECRMH